MTEANITIRVARPADAPAISNLVAQLGYPAPAEVIPDRLANIEKSPDATALVAEDSTGKVVGVMTLHLIWSIHNDPPIAWLTALVVLDSARSQGVGSEMLGWAEDWAKKKGAQKLSLSSGIHRVETHAYYDNRGYERSGLRFTKKFGEG